MYLSSTGSVGEISPFFQYLTKYPNSNDRVHDYVIGNPSLSDNDIDDYPTITNGSFTVFLPLICDRANFDAVESIDRRKLDDLISDPPLATYTNGYYNSDNYLLEDILFNHSKGPIAIAGVRYNSSLLEDVAYLSCFTNLIAGGECTLGRIARSAKLYGQLDYENGKSRILNDGTALGDVVLLGDPALILNIANKGADLAKTSNLSLSSLNGEIKAQWAPVSGASGYAISIGYINEIPLRTEFTSRSNFSFLSLINEKRLAHGARYYVFVRPFKNVYDANGIIRTYDRSKSAVSSSIILDAFVEPPTNVSASVSSSNVIVTFTKSSDLDVARYKIYRKTEGNSATYLAVLSSSANTFTDNAAEIGRPYVYSIVAEDLNGNSSIETNSNEVIIPNPSTITISGSCDLKVYPSPTTIVFPNNTYKYGAMISVRNKGLNDSVMVQWFGVLDQNSSNCTNHIANLFGNGAQISNFCTPRAIGNKMYFEVNSKKPCQIHIEINNWQNGTGCN
jgi:hypothetical protein